MTKQDFLEMLRLALNGRVAPGQVIENLQFYEDYINTEIRKGKSEETVLAELGDPRLIARTIAETGKQGQSAGYSAEDEAWEREEYQPYEQSGQTHLRLFSKVPVWAWAALVLLVIVMILGAVFSLLAALLPVLVPIIVVVFLVKAFRDWFH